MKRLTLAGQMAAIITMAVFLAQAINLAIAVENRRTLLLGQVVLPAAHRLAFAAAAPDRAPIQQSRVKPAKAPQSRPREPKITARFPARDDAQREKRAEAILAEAFAQQSIAVPELRAVSVREGANRESVVLLAARLGDGRWVSVESPPQQPLGPLVLILSLQAILIALAVLVPTLLLLRRVGGSLTSLADSAADFDPRKPPKPVHVAGPSDIRRLVEAVNAMQARIADMLRERDIMLGAIGHDLRTPLTALRLEAEAVVDDVQRSNLVSQIEQLHEELERILLLAKSAQPALAWREFDLAELLGDLSEGACAGRSGDWTKPCRVKGDPRALRRAVQNLIDNGLRYGDRVELDLACDSKMASISVNDRGPGLSAEEKIRALEPFQRLEPSRNRDTGGHGLGLAIVDAIARAHGGTLELRDREGGGLSATIRISRADNPPTPGPAVDSGRPLP